MSHSQEEIGNSIGYSSKDVYQRGVDYEVKKICSMTLETFSGYMEELTELNILKHYSDDSYAFLRQNFLQMMGTSNEILDKLDKYLDSRYTEEA